MELSDIEKFIMEHEDLLPEHASNKSQAIRLSDIPIDDNETLWLIDGYIPIGDMMLISGEPGSGKSSLVASWVSAITTGKNWMDKEVIEGNVLYIFLEDRRVKLARMMRDLEADRRRIHVLQEVSTSKPILQFNAQDTFKLPDDIGILMEEIRVHKPVLIVIDALGRITNRVSKIKQEEIASSIASIALTRGIGVAIVNHIKQGPYNVNNITSRLENPLFHQRARTSFLSVYDKTSGIRGLINIKSNGEEQAPFLFRITKQVNGHIRVIPVTNQRLLTNPNYESEEINGKILACLAKYGPSTPIFICQTIDENYSTIRVYVRRLLQKGLITEMKGYKYALHENIAIGMDITSHNEVRALQSEKEELQELQSGVTTSSKSTSGKLQELQELQPIDTTTTETTVMGEETAIVQGTSTFSHNLGKSSTKRKSKASIDETLP